MSYEEDYAKTWQGYDKQGLTVEELQEQLAKLVVDKGMVDFLPIDSEELADLAVTASKLAEDSVYGNAIQDNVIDAVHMSPNSIGSLAIQDLAVISAHIAYGAIGEVHIAEAAIGSAAIQDLAVQTAHINDAAITSAKIGNAVIKNVHISDASIDSLAVQHGAINNLHFDRATGNQIQIVDGDIVNVNASKLNAGIIDTAKVTIQGDNGHLRMVGNRIQVFDDQDPAIERVAMGDINTDGNVYGFRVRGADGLTVLYDHTGVYTEGITDGAITNPKIGDDEVDGRAIAARSVTAQHMVTDTITANSGVIADAAITNAMIDYVDADKISANSLSAISADLGYVTAGTIDADLINVVGTIDSAKFVSTDGYSQMVLDDGSGVINNGPSYTIWNAFGIQVGSGDPITNPIRGLILADGYIESDHSEIDINNPLNVGGDIYINGFNRVYHEGFKPDTYSSLYTDNLHTNLIETRNSGNLIFDIDSNGDFEFNDGYIRNNVGGNHSQFMHNDSVYIKLYDVGSGGGDKAVQFWINGAVKAAWTSLPKIRLDPDDSVMTDNSFAVNNPGSMQPRLDDVIVLHNNETYYLDERFKSFAGNYHVFVNNGKVIDKQTDHFTVSGKGEIVCLIMGIQKGKEEVCGYDVVTDNHIAKNENQGKIKGDLIESKRKSKGVFR